MVSLKNKSDDSDLCIFLLSGLIAALYLGIRDDIPLELVLLVLFLHVLGSVFIWRKVEQWRFLLGRNWKWIALTLFSFFFVNVFLMIVLALLCLFLEAFFGIPLEKSGFLGVIVTNWSIAFLWPLMSWVIESILSSKTDFR